MLRNARSACLEAFGHKAEFFSSLLAIPIGYGNEAYLGAVGGKG